MNPQTALRKLARRWEGARAKERSNAQSYLKELARALGVEEPRPSGSGYEFELEVKMVTPDGQEKTGQIDLFKSGCFLLEAKDEGDGKPTDLLMRRAFGQARNYAAHVAGDPPPYLMVLDVASTLIVWDRWSGTYGGFNAGYRIDVRKLAEQPEDIALLRDIWDNPEVRDPRAKANAVTKEVAVHLAELAASLEERGHDQELVARFLMRVVFTLFAEDIGLLPEHPFERAIREVGFQSPDEFVQATRELWSAMDVGGRIGWPGKRLLKFNGHFFRDVETLPLTKADLAILYEASKADWKFVEPTIFGTLLTRALNPEERHRLGAEYTPREFVERLVRPTIEEPVRERWTSVQVEVIQLLETGKKKDGKLALLRLREFHSWLRGLNVLDPACGSGNFLYVGLHTLKRIELEVLRQMEEITGQPEMAVEEVGPWQFHGIEVKPWAREIAELTLWIGFHQFWWNAHGHILPPEPVLRDTGTLELRDAVLCWDEIIHRPEKDRADPAPRIVHPVTGKLVPDPNAKLPYLEYHGARQAEWPRADFIIGNPPYLGKSRQREAFGDGYVGSLRAAYPEVPDSADYVMYWWHRAAREVAAGRTLRAGLITTQSIVQAMSRGILQDAAERGARIAWAIPDHAWCDGTTGAEVRVAMTVIAKEPTSAKLVQVEYTRYLEAQKPPAIVQELTVPRLNFDLTAHADIASASSVPLSSNSGLAAHGVMVAGAGFILGAAEARKFLDADPRHVEVIRPYVNGKDLTARPRDVFVIDFGLRDEAEAQQYPIPYDLTRIRVKPERDANAREGRRRYWWRFGEPNPKLRQMLTGLHRYIATVETAKHHFFTFLNSEVTPDHKLVCIASGDAFHLGVLSSRLHKAWALAAGAALEDKPVYAKKSCFDPFPFPAASAFLRERIGDLAERLDAYRKDAVARSAAITMTGIYNVLDKLCTGAMLTPQERKIYELGAIGVIRDIHEELDQLVAEAYGWEWPMARDEMLERLVALHDERVVAESQGNVRWLRPEYQRPRFAPESVQQDMEVISLPSGPREGDVTPWPGTVIEQIASLKRLVDREPVTPAEGASRFKGARRDLVARHLETLALLGEVQRTADGRYRTWPAAA